MISHSTEYESAVTGDVRRTYIRAILNLVSPNIIYGAVSGSAQAAEYSRPDQASDGAIDSGDTYGTLEWNRFPLDGSVKILPETAAEIVGQVGIVGAEICDREGIFTEAQIFMQEFTGVDVVQACSIYFSSENNGTAVDFTMEILQGDVVAYTQAYTGNRAGYVVATGFTIENPTAIRVSITRWSLPFRRVRITEMLPGLNETWNNDIFSAMNIAQQANFTNLALPYGTCTLEIDNSDKRFEPRNKNSFFRSIEARQGILVSIGVRLRDGSVEYMPIGKYYQFSGGWETSNNDLSIRWDLVDIIGMLTDRDFVVPATLPTTLEGWAAAVTAQLGVGFAKMYTVDADYAQMAVTAKSADAISGMKCGDIIRYMCMATGTYASADVYTGKLRIRTLPETGTAVTLDNLVSYPTTRGNDDIGALLFTLSNGSQVLFSGTEAASNESVSIENPFLHTIEAAQVAAAMILQFYGGNQVECTGRGDPSTELGDIDTIELGEGSTAIGRRIAQSFAYESGVLQNCQSLYLEVER